MQRKLLSCFIVIIVLCTMFAGNASPKEKPPVLPPEYPAEWGVIFNPTRTLYEPANQFSFQTYLGFFPGVTETLTAETVLAPGTMALPCDITWDHDVPITLRDGVTIYVDVFRPTGVTEKLPAIIAWTPYGKSLPHDPTEHFGESVPGAWVSGLTRFEGPDPAFWSCNGYAIINVDNRGAFKSEGTIYYWGSVDAADGYEVVEWAAQQDWSSGKVGMHGTSWLAISQWYIAATQPPHLAALAPWGAHHYDQYRFDVCRGGIPDVFFNRYISTGFTGDEDGNYGEAPYDMVTKYPLMHPYWQDKVVKMENIKIPTYSVGPYARGLAAGDLDGFRAIASKDKWLRIENTGEWHDQYTPANQQDLLRFFDRYLKSIDNAWEATPKVRAVVSDPGGVDQVNVPFSSWPLVETHYRKFHLDAANGTLSRHPSTKASSASYDALTGQATFTIRFDEDTYVIGYPKLSLWVEAAGANDMDLFVLVEKIDNDGNVLTTANGYAGPDGRLRASLRALDHKLSTHYRPVYAFLENEFLESGQVVPVDIAMASTGMLWHAGEQLRLTVAGNKLAGTVLFIPGQTINAGSHIIHTGPGHQSHLQLPIIPAKK